MIYGRLPTTTFILSMDRCGNTFEAVLLIDATHSTHTPLSSPVGFAPECIWIAASPPVKCPVPPEAVWTGSQLRRSYIKTKCSHQCKHPARAAHPSALCPYMARVCLSRVHSLPHARVPAWLSYLLSTSLPVFLTPHKPPAAWCNACLCMCAHAFVCFYLARKPSGESLLTLPTLSLFVCSSLLPNRFSIFSFLSFPLSFSIWVCAYLCVFGLLPLKCLDLFGFFLSYKHLKSSLICKLGSKA